MGERIRALDWASTPLGPAASWPQSLRSAISILLPSKAQICMFWGPDFVKLYNDAYIPVLGNKHGSVLGRPGRDVWPEIWDVLGPLLKGVIDTGEAFHASDHPFYLFRHGFAEETYFDVSYDPVRDETGRVGGVFCIVTETTGRVLSERRLRTLRDLARVKESRSAEEACRLALPVLAASAQDVPFASLYLLDGDGKVAHCCGSVGVPSLTRSPTGTGAFGSGMMLRSRAGIVGSAGCDGVSLARFGSVARCRSFAASDAKRAGTGTPYTSSTACTKRCSGTMIGSMVNDSV